MPMDATDRAHPQLRIAVFSEEPAALSELVSALPPDVSAVRITEMARLADDLTEPSPDVLVFVLPRSDYPRSRDLDALLDLDKQVPLVLVAWDHDISVPVLSALMPYRPLALISAPFEAQGFRAILRKALDGGPVEDGEPPLDVTLAEANRKLNQRLQEINAIYTVGKSVASSLDTDVILDRVVLAAVNLTQADDGFIVLQEGESLFLRVVKYLNSRYPDHLHDETTDKVAWQVIRSGRPTMLHREARLSTGMLVRALLYVPLQTPESGTIGVLGVVNRVKDEPFSENQLFALSSIADFAAIALDNARLFSQREAERSRLSAILARAAEAIIVTDPDTRLWLWSDAAGRLFGFDEDSQGSLLDEYVENKGLRDLFTRAGQEGSAVKSEIVFEDGRTYNAQLSTIESIGHVVVMQDITNLMELDRLKSEFVSTVSHDLRTPLTTIQGYVELLDRVGPLNEMQQNFVGRALRSLNHITELISDLLDIGRIEAGYDLEMHRTRLDELIRLTVDATQTQAVSAGIHLTADLPRSALLVWGNHRRLRQVMENLISNAIKYNRPQGWVKVLARRESDHYLVQVSDSGIGIDTTEEGRIFDRFYRVQSPETEDVQGTGLGLSIVKSVIEKHKGRVWVESAPGEGSTFTFVLPVLEDRH